MDYVYYDFLAVADIWKAYFAGSISMVKRDRLLEAYRAPLRARRK